MCRIDTGLARKADTWYSGCTKKVMFQKHTGTAILLRWLKPITVHEGAMSIIHYRTLRANHSFAVFHLSCNKHVSYNRSLFMWILGGWWCTGEKKEDPAAVSIHDPSSATSLLHHVASASSCSIGEDAVLQYSPKQNSDVIQCCWACPAGGRYSPSSSH